MMDVATPCTHASGDCHEPVPSKSFSNSGTFAPVSVTAALNVHVRSLPLCTTLTTVIGAAAAALSTERSAEAAQDLEIEERVAKKYLRHRCAYEKRSQTARTASRDYGQRESNA